ncbi:hypothetical protein QAD02_018328 [Eretmocerus hayati]|uniref:Uncharacterized protein n=1 Tax=Eretmocerus hayati TaxID=131215 RepID=A0ACC2PGD3_9HYME|nr:hypothetical protein QAD02_018328 [Eretmocerus hayati]
MSREVAKLLITELMFNRTNYYGLIMIPERVSLTMGILELEGESGSFNRIANMLENFIFINPLTRGKYLMNIMSEARIDLLRFFRMAWTYKFLDLTIIQWIQMEHTLVIDSNYTSMADFRGVVHSYDPLTDTINQKSLTESAEIFPNKLRNMKQFLLFINAPFHLSRGKIMESNDRWTALRDLDGVDLMKILFDTLNCSMKILVDSEYSVAAPLVDNVRIITSDISQRDYHFLLPIYILNVNSFTGDEWAWTLKYQLEEFPIPSSIVSHFHVMLPNIYERQLSFVAILTFGGLFFTAFIFAVWVQFLGFEERNWSFLNILTAQMGGSIEHRGPMKLSEKIFLMSMYVATFIIVTLGSDYMFEIFVLYQKNVEISTIQDLVNLNVDFILDFEDWIIFANLPKDSLLEKFPERIEFRNLDSKSHSFCRLPLTESSILDESINLCITTSDQNRYMMKSNNNFTIHHIKDNIGVSFPLMRTGNPPSVFKLRAEELMYKFREVGILNKLEADNLRSQIRKKGFGRSLQSEKTEDEKVPLQDQLLPIFLVGCTIALLALVGELFWKRFIERTEFGGIVRAFYSDPQQVPVHPRGSTGHITRREWQPRST